MEESSRGLIFRSYHRIFLEGLRQTTKCFSQDSRSLRRDLNPRAPDYEGMLTTRPRPSYLRCQKCNKYIGEIATAWSKCNLSNYADPYCQYQYQYRCGGHTRRPNHRDHFVDLLCISICFIPPIVP